MTITVGMASFWKVELLIAIKGASSLHTPFFELVRMIKLLGLNRLIKIYCCHVPPMSCPRHNVHMHFHGLPQICRLQV